MWRRLLHWVQKRWLRGMPALEHVRVTLYTRKGCHLCDVAADHLQREQRRFGFKIDCIDIDTSAELISMYGEQVPVVMVDGKLRFRGVVNVVLLRRLLEAEAQR